MDIQTFFEYPTVEIAHQIEALGSGICGLPINGTQRWFELEYPGQTAEAYVRLTSQQHLDVYQLLFEHGLHTLLAPLFNPLMERRGPAYIALILRGLADWLASPGFDDLCQVMGIRVNFYGDWRRYFAGNGMIELIEVFDSVIGVTRSNGPRRLFFGVCANNATNHLLELALDYHQETGQMPDLLALTRCYYGEAISPANLYLSYNKPAVFDVPLLVDDRTDLYFAVSPLLYLDQQSLRAVLYDHLYVRPVTEPAYAQLSTEARARLKTFYQRYRHVVQGLGSWRTEFGIHRRLRLSSRENGY